MKMTEIAKELGLSVSTVSKALGDATDISRETRDRVLRFVGKDSQNTEAPKRIMAILEDMNETRDYIGYDILSGFKNMAGLYNYEVVVRAYRRENTMNFNSEMSGGNFVAAFVMGTNLNSALYKELKTAQFPTVIFDNFIDNPLIATISVDNINPICQIVEYLAGLGHTKIAMLDGEKASAVSRERLGGYVAGLVSAGLAIDEKLMKFGDFSDKCGEQHADSIIASGATAVVCASDLIAIGLMQALKRRGKIVPDDISVTGFDDIAYSRYLTPALTTISQNFEAIGKSAFTMLRELIKHHAPDRVIMSGKLTIRASSTAPKSSTR